jgi:hypothetical protein
MVLDLQGQAPSAHALLAWMRASDALQRLAAPLNIMDSWYVRAWVVKGE